MGKILIVTNNKEKYLYIDNIFKKNGIHTFLIPSKINDIIDMSDYIFNKLNASYALEVGNDNLINIFDKTVKKIDTIKGELNKGIEEIILKYFSYNLDKLTTRNDYSFLTNFYDENIIDFKTNFGDWIRNNKLFNYINNDFYNDLINYTLMNEGMFPKVWSISRQKNYWNLPYNSGIPIVPKKDEIHEGTFLFHDISHFLFMDPILTYSEAAIEKKVYIMHRMMSEAVTLVMADMFLIEASGIKKEYNTNKRKIFPLFESIPKKDNELLLFRIFKIMYANAYYALIGDDYYFKLLSDNKNNLNDYKDKYGIFFSADYQWNHENIVSIDKRNKNKDFSEYFSNLPIGIKKYSTKDASNIVVKNNKIIFDKIFYQFWDRFLKLLDFKEGYNHLKYMKKSIEKYISGQLKIFYDFKEYDISNNKQEIIEFLNKVQNYSSEEKLNLDFIKINKKIHSFIDLLNNNGVITKIDSKLFKLHYTHFDTNFISYDKKKETYNSIDYQFDNIIGKDNVIYEYTDLNDLFSSFMTKKDILKYNDLYIKKMANASNG